MGRLQDLLRAAKGERSMSPAVGRWADAVSQATDNFDLRNADIAFPTVRPGVGANAPVQIPAGPTLGYIMQVGDYVYVEQPIVRGWNNSTVIVGISWAPAGSEVGRLVNWRIDVGFEYEGSDLTAVNFIGTAGDVAVPETAATYVRTGIAIPASAIAAVDSGSVDEFHIRVTRTANASDPVSDPGIHHIAVIQGLYT